MGRIIKLNESSLKRIIRESLSEIVGQGNGATGIEGALHIHKMSQNQAMSIRNRFIIFITIDGVEYAFNHYFRLSEEEQVFDAAEKLTKIAKRMGINVEDGCIYETSGRYGDVCGTYQDGFWND